MKAGLCLEFSGIGKAVFSYNIVNFYHDIPVYHFLI